MTSRYEAAIGVVVMPFVAAYILALTVGPVFSQKPDPGPNTPKAMSELDALKIGKLYAERMTLEQALLKLQAQQESLRAQTQLTRLEYDAVNGHLQTVIVAAATAIGLTADDLKAGWQPSPERREWVKKDAN
jgi:hypothetical protein